MDIADLRDFITVVDCGSLTRAAAKLYVSQPAISQRVAQLEGELGVRLLERGPRGTAPTPSGRTLYREAQQLVRQFDRLVGDVREGGAQVHGSVAVGLPTTVAVRLAPALFAWTRERFPGVHLQLFESMSGYIQELLAVGRLDLAVLFRHDGTERPEETPLYAEDLYLLGSAPSLSTPEADGVGVPELRGIPLVVPGDRSGLRSLIDRACAARGLQPSVVADVDSLGAMLRIAGSGEACTILPLSSATDLAAGAAGDGAGGTGLEVRRIHSPVIERRASVINALQHYQPREAVAAVRQGIAEVTARMAADGEWPGIRLAPGVGVADAPGPRAG